MKIEKRIKSTKTGREIDVVINIEEGKLSGCATYNGAEYNITNVSVINGNKVLTVSDAPFVGIPIDAQMYNSLCAEIKRQREAMKTDEDRMWDAVCAAEAAYINAQCRNDGWDEVIKAQTKYEDLIAMFRARYPNSERLISNRVSFANPDHNLWVD